VKMSRAAFIRQIASLGGGVWDHNPETGDYFYMLGIRRFVSVTPTSIRLIDDYIGDWTLNITAKEYQTIVNLFVYDIEIEVPINVWESETTP